MPIRLPGSPARSLLRKLIAAGLRAADPYHAILQSVSYTGQSVRVGRKTHDLSRFKRVFAVGAGKASARMAQALEHVLGSRLEGGFIVVKTGHSVPTERITIVEAAHPIPDHAGLLAAKRLRTLIQDFTPRDLLFVLLSGGASSLLPAPVPGVTLADTQRTTRLLLRGGATIQELNAVRKHLSLLKGGGLAASTHATIVTLILSDVIGDDLGTIGSGPTAPDSTTFADAIDVLRRYGLWSTAPEAIRRHLLAGRQGRASETLKAGSRRLLRVQHHIVGNNSDMLRAVVRAAQSAGLRTILSRPALVGEAHEAAHRFTHLAKPYIRGRKKSMRPVCIIAGGEPTVTITGRGKGGRRSLPPQPRWILRGFRMPGWRRSGQTAPMARLRWLAQWSPAQPWHKLNNVASSCTRYSGVMTPTQPSRLWDPTSTPGRRAPTSTTFTSSSSCRYYPP